jgi:hypothetical protein
MTATGSSNALPRGHLTADAAWCKRCSTTRSRQEGPPAAPAPEGGFTFAEDKRDPEFEALWGATGFRRFERAIWMNADNLGKPGRINCSTVEGSA